MIHNLWTDSYFRLQWCWSQLYDGDSFKMLVAGSLCTQFQRRLFLWKNRSSTSQSHQHTVCYIRLQHLGCLRVWFHGGIRSIPPWPCEKPSWLKRRPWKYISRIWMTLQGLDLEMNLRLTCGFWLSVRNSRNAYPAIIKASPIDRFDIKIEAKKPSFHILLAAQIDSPLVVK